MSGVAIDDSLEASSGSDVDLIWEYNLAGRVKVCVRKGLEPPTYWEKSEAILYKFPRSYEYITFITITVAVI